MDDFLIEDDDLLENHNTIWDKVSADIKKVFDSKLVYNKDFLKTKIFFTIKKFQLSSMLWSYLQHFLAVALKIFP